VKLSALRGKITLKSERVFYGDLVVQFVLYTEQTVAQALTALNARMQAKPSSSRPALDGWVEKNGAFSLGVTSLVAGRFNRTTFMRGRLEREGGMTVIKAQVSRGATRENMIVIFAVIAIVALMLVAMGSTWMGLLLLPIGAALYIPLAGDAFNSDLLIGELQKTLKAKDTPPTPSKTTSSKASPTARPAARKATTTTPRATGTTARAKPAPKPAPPTEPDDEDEEDSIIRVPVED
jgi:hypothetical protein